MTTNPHVDEAAATALGDVLRRLDYSEPAVISALGDDAFTTDAEDAVVAERRLPRTPQGTAIRMFFLQLPVSTGDAERALGRDGVAALEATGLAEVEHGDVVTRKRILPVGRVLVASDDFPEDDGDQPPDYVAAYSPTSRLLDSLTPRRRVERALDVGTGSGVQALLAARHARHVVATDVNDRALAYTQLNAALNGFTNIETRPGSLFEPTEEETFDLITCNAPYVVSPESRWIYRDAGLEADEVSERVVRSAGEQLAEGGYATLLVSWIAHDEADPDERPLAWTDGIGCDAWILPIWGADPLGHAATWNDQLNDEPEKLRDALDRWLSYLVRLNVRWVSEGAVLLHRTSSRRHTVRVDSLEEDDVDEAGAQIERAFANRAKLASLRKRADLLGARLALASPVLIEREIEPRRQSPKVVAAAARLLEGTGSAVEASPRALDVAGVLDGSRALSDVVEAEATRLRLSGSEKARLQREVLAVVDELLELGALRFV